MKITIRADEDEKIAQNLEISYMGKNVSCIVTAIEVIVDDDLGIEISESAKTLISDIMNEKVKTNE